MTSFQDAPDEAMEMTKQWRLVLVQYKYIVLNQRTSQNKTIVIFSFSNSMG